MNEEEIENRRGQSRKSSKNHRDKMRNDPEWIAKEQERERNRPKRQRKDNRKNRKRPNRKRPNRKRIDLPASPMISQGLNIQSFAEKSMDKLIVAGDHVATTISNYSTSVIKQAMKPPDSSSDDEDSSSGSDEESIVAVYSAKTSRPSSSNSRASVKPPPRTLGDIECVKSSNTAKPSRPSSSNSRSSVKSLPPTLSDIECVKSSKTGKMFYFNSVTNDSYWEPPRVAIEMRLDENKQPYYFNLITGEATSTEPITREGRMLLDGSNGGGAKRKRESSIVTPISRSSILSPSSQKPPKKKVKFNRSPFTRHPVRNATFRDPRPVWEKNPNELNMADAQAIIFRGKSNLDYTRQELKEAVDREHVLGERLRVLEDFVIIDMEPTPIGPLRSVNVVDEVQVISSSFDPELCDFIVDTFMTFDTFMTLH